MTESPFLTLSHEAVGYQAALRSRCEAEDETVDADALRAAMASAKAAYVETKRGEGWDADAVAAAERGFARGAHPLIHGRILNATLTDDELVGHTFAFTISGSEAAVILPACRERGVSDDLIWRVASGYRASAPLVLSNLASGRFGATEAAARRYLVVWFADVEAVHRQDRSNRRSTPEEHAAYMLGVELIADRCIAAHYARQKRGICITELMRPANQP